MYPNIPLGSQSLPSFSLCALIGILVFVLSVVFKLRKDPRLSEELFYIIPKLFIALGLGFLGTMFFDSLFKIPQNGGFKLAGMMFYGGVVTGVSALIPMLVLCRKNTRYSAGEWLDMITVPFILFHAIGRIGCFMAGCCYGMETTGPFGILFPDVPEAGIYHHGQKVLPTQLFESSALFILALVLHFIKRRKFAIYTVAYPIIRFMLEFLRDDNRGSYLGFLSPSQLISVIILVAVAVWFTVWLVKRKRAVRPHTQSPPEAADTASSEELSGEGVSE